MFTTKRASKKLIDNLVKSCFDCGLGFRITGDLRDSNKKLFSLQVDQQHPGDIVVNTDNIRIYLNPADATAIEGYILDYLDKPQGGFCLKQHNIVDGFPS